MITKENITRKKAAKILKLIEQMTEADVKSRLGKLPKLEFADWVNLRVQKEEELLEYIYGTSNIVELGKLRGWLKGYGRRKALKNGKHKKRK